MSNGIIYNPQPTRVWSRVQNSCTTNQNNTNIQNDIVYIPLTNQYVTPAQAQYQAQLFQKGNILQYKNNSANLTKNQKYSRLSNGLVNTRKKSYATQSVTYTNPNTSSLLRVNYASIPYPNQIVGAPNNPSGPYQPDMPNPFDCSSNILQDGGNLVCNAVVNPCSGKIIEQTTKSYQICNSSSCSDVPGKPIELCWYPGVQTWYPKQRYIMPNSLNKWPQGYKGFVSAVTLQAPVLDFTMNNSTEINLTWSVNNNLCLPISNYNIYQNNVLINTVSYQINSININNLIPNEIYNFYVESFSTTIPSEPSNIVTIYTMPNI
jgi:hypothetical protein